MSARRAVAGLEAEPVPVPAGAIWVAALRLDDNDGDVGVDAVRFGARVAGEGSLQGEAASPLSTCTGRGLKGAAKLTLGVTRIAQHATDKVCAKLLVRDRRITRRCEAVILIS